MRVARRPSERGAAAVELALLGRGHFVGERTLVTGFFPYLIINYYYPFLRLC